MQSIIITRKVFMALTFVKYRGKSVIGKLVYGKQEKKIVRIKSMNQYVTLKT